MQNISNKPTAAVSESLPVLAGAALAVSVVGAVLALTDLASPLRAPFTLFFLVVTPTAAVAAGLRGLEPLGRAVAAVAGAIAIDLLVAQAMLAMHIWSIRGGVAAIAGISALLFLLTLVRRPGDRTARRHSS
ncbi:hypothetical protein [Streptomyces sp. H27-C3]|uniref:hypothetical protein n=1 Tax=Streptomyces sp. H27-C3 TaxID=3046305 RepID=UPI0024BA66E7|nr:hypothetical protein [Streptomyces sp. H27-C3]MDJ0464564.1 hypothetical protein [Streptomyces sp. H27-C3]